MFQPSSRKTKILMFVAILLLAIFLRGFRLDSNPPGLYWEEVALGYDAYSIWRTGADHHGNRWLLVAFKSFGDWKPSLYFYLTAPFVGLLGLNAWAVRLPSMIAGVFIVIGVGVLTKLVWQLLVHQRNDSLLLLGMAVTTISPWAIQFSRGGWEVNVATALILWGVIAGLWYWMKKGWLWLVLSAILLILSMYTYHAARIIAPLLGLAIIVIGVAFNKLLFKPFFSQKSRVLVLLVVVIVLLLPFANAWGSTQLTQRFTETGIFSNIELILQSNRYIDLGGGSSWARFTYHRYWFFAKEMLQNLFSHLTLDFLFVAGDTNPRHSVQYFGHLYYLDLIFLTIGWLFLLKNHSQKIVWLLFSWLVIGILPASITMAAPHALRILPTMPIFLLSISIGIYQGLSVINCSKQFKMVAWQKMVASCVLIGYLGLLGWYQHYYWQVYPVAAAGHWQAGYPKLIDVIQQLKTQHPDQTIVVSRSWGRPAMYYWFYSKIDPKLVQAQADTAKKDQGEFLEFDNLRFSNEGFEKGDIMVRLEDSQEL